MLIPTIEKLFEHKCLFKDMKLSGFNPENLSYYCGVCGGKLSLNKTKQADEYIKAKANLKLSRQLYLLCTTPDSTPVKEVATKETKMIAKPAAKVVDKSVAIPVGTTVEVAAKPAAKSTKKATGKKSKKAKKR